MLLGLVRIAELYVKLMSADAKFRPLSSATVKLTATVTVWPASTL